MDVCLTIISPSAHPTIPSPPSAVAVRRARSGASLAALLALLSLSACSEREKELLLATTTSTYDTGLLDALLPAFERQTGYRLKAIAVGTGEALKMGERGDADVLLVHAPEAEEEFMGHGHGRDRAAVMHNEFVLLGPATDPAGVCGQAPAAALARVAAGGAHFVSRADNSGTHACELRLWAAAGLSPAGPWYIRAGQGMAETLRIASEKGAYVLADKATWLVLKSTLSLEVLVENDKALLNAYHVITVNPAGRPRVNHVAARAFMDFITGPQGQRIIAEFGTERFGTPIFAPNAM